MPADTQSPAAEIALLADQSLVLRVDRSVEAAVAPWIPRHRTRAADGQHRIRRAVLEVDAEGEIAAQDTIADDRSPTLTLGGVAAVVGKDGARLRGTAGLRGSIDLATLRARVSLGAAPSAPDVHGGLTLAAALLLGRMGKALVHAGALVDPHGDGWLLVGDSHSGKTTTCATLLTAGWRYVADDQIVLGSSSDCVVAEGWPREAHLDPGWHVGELTDTRVGADLGDVRADAWAARVIVKGLLFPSIQADRPTQLAPITASDALARVIRQSPWLLADREVASATLALLTRVVARSCSALLLGRDSYANADRLESCLAPVTGSEAPPVE